MAAIDWSRGDLSHRLRVLMLDPQNLTTVRGELRNVNVGGKLDLSYYSDTRMGASIDTAGDDGWDGSAALRLVHEVHDFTGLLLTEPLGTFHVTKRDWKKTDGGETGASYTLSSPLAGLASAKVPINYGIGRGVKALDAMRKVFGQTTTPYAIAGGARNYTFSKAVIYEPGTTFISILFDLCDRSNNRLSVDALGRVTVSPYVSPTSKAPSFTTDASDERGQFVPQLTGGDAALERYGRVIVAAKDGDRLITAQASAPAGNRASERYRGYTKDDFRQLNDMSPFTKAQAQALAKRYLNADLTTDQKCSHSLTYRPLREEDVELLTIGGSSYRWHVYSASLDLASWTWNLDLRGGWRA